MTQPIKQLPPLILASASIYRQELLSRLHLPFTVQTSDFDEREYESILVDYSPVEKARLIAYGKLHAVKEKMRKENGDNNNVDSVNNNVVIASDQYAYVVATKNSLHKPKTIENNKKQLQELSGQEVCFETSVAVSYQGQVWTGVIPTFITFRKLDEETINRYVSLEPALDCAGGAKLEGLGISLIKTFQSEDPTAIIGLPLITLSSILREIGFPV
jgi:septum formation protein